MNYRFLSLVLNFFITITLFGADSGPQPGTPAFGAVMVRPRPFSFEITPVRLPGSTAPVASPVQHFRTGQPPTPSGSPVNAPVPQPVIPVIPLLLLPAPAPINHGQAPAQQPSHDQHVLTAPQTPYYRVEETSTVFPASPSLPVSPSLVDYHQQAIENAKKWGLNTSAAAYPDHSPQPPTRHLVAPHHAASEQSQVTPPAPAPTAIHQNNNNRPLTLYEKLSACWNRCKSRCCK